METSPEPIPWYDVKGRLRYEMISLKERLLAHPLLEELRPGHSGDTSDGPSSLPPPSLIHSLETHLINLQSILLWDNPSKSLFAMGCFTLGYWFLVAWTRSIFSLICSFIFFVKLYSLWTHYVWPEIRVPPTEDQREREDWIPVHPNALSAPEIKRFMDQSKEVASSFFTCLLNFRKTNRGLFCIVMSTTFVIVGILGSTVSGALVVYMTLMTMALAPGLLLHVLPTGFVPMVKSFFPICPCDDGTDVFAEVPTECIKVSSPTATESCSGGFPLPMLFDLISNSSDSNQDTSSEATFFQRKVEVQEDVTASQRTEAGSLESHPPLDVAESQESFIRRAISSAISFGSIKTNSSSGGNSPKDGAESPGNGDRSPGGSSGRSSNGIKIVASHYNDSPGTPGESDDNMESYEIVTDTEINQL